jgi:hypothetical protein
MHRPRSHLRAAKRAVDRPDQQAIAHHSAVDGDHDLPGPARGKQKAGHGQTPGSVADGPGLPGASRARQVGEALPGLANGRQAE